MIRRLDLSEDSPNTLEGSFTKDLLFSKFWLCNLIAKSMKISKKFKFGQTYVLGSWFGNMFLILREHAIPCGKVFLVDRDPVAIDVSRKMLTGIDPDLKFVLADANDLSYGMPGEDMLVINTSCNDMMDSTGWFNRIPPGATVALQSRNDVETMTEMDDRFPLGRVDFIGSRTFSDPEKTYRRLSKVGVK